MPVARCKYCNRLLFNEDVGREYIQINSDMKIQSKFICLKCEMELRKGRLKEFYDFPTFKLNYIRAFDRMLEARKAKNLPTQWESGEEVFLWWIEDKNVAGQREFKVAENGQLMW